MIGPIVPSPAELDPDPNPASARAPGAGDPSGTFSAHVRLRRRPRYFTQSWLAAAGYLVLGLCLGLGILLLLGLLSKRDTLLLGLLSKRDTPVAAHDGQPHEIIHLHLDSTCWQGINATDRTSRLTVVMLVGVDGHVHSTSSAGATPAMRSCVETYARGMEFQPLAHAQTFIVPIEVDGN
ncbi:MAG: hypothetical protein FWD73_04890 [Polyangiaceae bacterium]|nr:hypothetical protein [Polyangiaceae bacterium]